MKTIKNTTTMTQQELESIFVRRRAAHKAKMRELQLQEEEIQKQRSILKQDYKEINKFLSLLATPSADSIRNDRKRVGYILRHKIGKLLNEFNYKKHYDTTQAVANFNINEDGTMTINVNIPLKQE